MTCRTPAQRWRIVLGELALIAAGAEHRDEFLGAAGEVLGIFVASDPRSDDRAQRLAALHARIDTTVECADAVCDVHGLPR